jgi:hypothetical protein
MSRLRREKIGMGKLDMGRVAGICVAARGGCGVVGDCAGSGIIMVMKGVERLRSRSRSRLWEK